MNENIDDIVTFGQRIVRTASDEYGRAFVCKLLDGVKLCKKNLLTDRHIHEAGCIVSERIRIHYQIVEKRIGGALILLFNHFLAKAAVACDMRNQILVIVFDSIALGNLFSDFTSAGTKLSSNCDDRIHTFPPYNQSVLRSFPNTFPISNPLYFKKHQRKSRRNCLQCDRWVFLRVYYKGKGSLMQTKLCISDRKQR